jgi:hypothetical protein
MHFKTLLQAQAEKRRRLYPHEIVKFEKHKQDCLYSNNSILSPYSCTCGGTGIYVYSLKLL